MSDIFVGRQPIFDVELNVYAYELLFRSGEGQADANVIDGDGATSQVMLNAFVDIGLDKLVGNHKAFINLTQYYLEDPQRVSMPAGQIVLEVLEDVEPNARVIETLTSLKKRGHIIALDDFVYADNFQPLINLADIVKIDIMTLGKSEIEQHVRLLTRRNLRLLAEKVETYEEFEYLKRLGFDYYQGYFFAKPTVVKGKGLKTNKLATLRLVAQINRPEVDVHELSQIINNDVGLSHKVLKFSNSAASGLRVEVSSVHHAILLIGITTIKNWVSIVALATESDKPHELSTLALARARICEQLARAGRMASPESFFTAGLFSMLEAMMDFPISELLEDLPLAVELKTGLLKQTGLYGEAIRCAIAMERNQVNEIRFFDLEISTMSQLYLDSLIWADRQTSAMAG